MSESESQDLQIKAEIQELLGQINDDMLKLKTELMSMNDLIEENASLPLTMKLVNEKLITMAKKAGIDLENLGDIENLFDLKEEEGETPQNNVAAQSNSDPSKVTDARALSAAADQLTKRIKSALK